MRKFNKLWLVIIMLGWSLHPVVAQQFSRSYEINYKGTFSGNRAVVYDQMSNPAGTMLVSQEFTDNASLNYTCSGADDFVVPQDQTWTIGGVALNGYYFEADDGGFEKFNLSFYSDQEGKPGDLLYEFLGIETFFLTEVPVGETVMTQFEVILPQSVTLNSGKFWVSAQIVGDMEEQGRWGWALAMNDPNIEEKWHWQNPGDGYGTGFTTWVSGEQIMPMAYYDFSYGLLGPNSQIDGEISGLVSPVNAQDLDQESIVVKIKNNGLETISSFTMKYSANGGIEKIEEVLMDIPALEVVEFTFQDKLDMTQPGLYQIDVEINLPGDESLENNKKTYSVYNYGEVVMLDGHPSYTSCGVTFTDEGGLDGDFDMSAQGQTTFFPGEDGKMVMMDFLAFDLGFASFKIYNGENTDAPLLGEWSENNSPGKVIATNEQGALTIDFQGTGWDNGAGWIAFVSCYDTPDDDFSVSKFSLSNYSVFENTPVELSVLVMNKGLLSQQKQVQFYMDDLLIETLNSGLLDFGQDTVISFITNALPEGECVLSASVTDDAVIDDNRIEKAIKVWPKNAFVEFFEDETFLPRFWNSLQWEQYDGVASCMVSAGEEAGLRTPLLNIEPGDKFSFVAKNTPWWPGQLKVCWVDGETNEVHELQNCTLDMSFNNYEIDLTPAAGHNYISFVAYYDAFYGVGKIFIDNVMSEDVELFLHENDLSVKTFSFDITPKVNTPVKFNFQIENIGDVDVSGDSYSIDLVKKINEETIVLKSMEGVDVVSLGQLVGDFEYVFNSEYEVELALIVNYSDDQQLSNNETNPQSIFVLPENLNQINIGEGNLMDSNIPISTNYASGVSQMIYPAEVLPEIGAITGVSFFYNKDDYDQSTDFAVKIWMQNIEEGATLDQFADFDDYQLLYDGEIELLNGDHELFLNFDVPFSHEGNDVAIYVYSEYSGNWLNVSFKQSSTDEVRAINFMDSNAIDYENPETLSSYPSMTLPNITFFVNEDGNGDLAGYLTDVNGVGISGAEIEIDGVAGVYYSNDQGQFTIEGIVVGEYIINTRALGYESTSVSVEILPGQLSTVNVMLTQKPLVTIMGRIVGDDNPDVGLPGVLVKLSGYDDHEVVSAEDGSFELPAVYGNEDYFITIEHPAYGLYDQSLTVEANNIDLGTVILAELHKVAIEVMATENVNTVNVSWKSPVHGEEVLIQLDDDQHDNGFANDPGENVWLGNQYQTNEPLTITGFDIYFSTQGFNTQSDWVSVEILNPMGELLMRSEPFITISDGWANVNCPPVTVNGEYYVMIHWDDVPNTTDFLAIDGASGAVEGTASIKYPGQTIEPLSNYVDFNGFFMIRNHALVASAKESKSLMGYNVYKGTVATLEQAEQWEKLNETIVTEQSLTDDQWPPQNHDSYVYAVQAVYSANMSPLSFSSALIYDNVAPEFSSEPEIEGVKGAVYLYEIVAQDANQDQLVIEAIEKPQWLDLIDNGDGTASMSGMVPELGEYDITLSVNDGQLSSTQSYVISVTTTVGVNELQPGSLRIYPNPASGFIMVDNLCDNAIIHVCDMSGVVISEHKVSDEKVRLDLGAFAPGFYLIKVNCQGKLFVNKLILVN